MPDETDDELDDSLPLRELTRIAGGRCRDCEVPFSAKEAVWSIALGFKNAPRCLTCLSRRLGRDAPDLRASLTDYVHRRECYLRAWQEAEMIDGSIIGTVTPTTRKRSPEGEMSDPGGVTPESPPTPPAEWWDAGDLGCGELVMQLRMRLKEMAAGSVIRVTATDPAAPEDIPAWCRLTGHTLLTADHPTYTIRRREG